MNIDLRNNLLVVVINNIVTEYDLDKIDKLSIIFNKDLDTLEVKETKSTHTVVSLNPAKPKPHKLPPTPHAAPIIATPIQPAFTWEDLKDKGWTLDQIKNSEWAHLLPKEEIEEKQIDEMNKELINLLDKTQGSETDYDKLKSDAIKKRGKVREYIPRKITNKKPFKRSPKVLAKFSTKTIIHIYIAYRQQTLTAKELASSYGIKTSTLYNWCSIITRIITKNPIRKTPHKKLQEAANRIINNNLLEIPENLSKA